MARPFIELFINNQKVYFSNPPTILLTYAHTDLHNPTVVKNSYTKTITIEGTPENNVIFNNFYDMRRMGGTGLFKPSRKETFALYKNGEPMENGYVRLDKVNRVDDTITYDITLYGGLGQFLYNLQTKEDGTPMKLSDLEYDFDMSLEVNKTNVLYAWNRINNYKPYSSTPAWLTDDYKIFDKINFAPCYNGIPENFSADKVAIDVQSFINADDEDLSSQFVTSKDGYTTINGWVLGELKKEYDENQMFDMRSYLQRPVIKFKEIIKACCNPQNNGGYTVDLDNDFFNENNEYYENAWMTLPLISEMELEEETSSSLVYKDGKYTISGVNSGSKIKVTIPYSLGVDASSSSSELRTYYKYSYASVGAGTYLEAFSDVARYIQLIAYDSNGKAVGASNIKSFHSTSSNDYHYTYEKEYDSNVTDIIGTYVKNGDTYRFVSNDTDTFDFTINNIEYTTGLTLKFVEKWLVVNTGNFIATKNTLFGDATISVNEWILDVYPNNANIVKLLGDGKKITKKNLLNSEKTPCDYFLSYLKMFNLHIWKDMYDNIIYVRQRNNYFTGVITDIDDNIDRGNAITIKPLTFENKWLNFKTEYESDEKLHKDYKDEYGLDYGIQKVDTNYSFDNSSKDVLDNFVFKGCVTHRAKSKYFIDLHTNVSEDIQYPPFILDGCQTLLFKNGDTTEGSYLTPKTSAVSKQLWKEQYYDLIPRPNFTDKDNKTVDGANVLLFYNGQHKTTNNEGETILLNISDDIPQFDQLNGGEPCWIWTYNSSIVSTPPFLPIFSRYITNENGWITHSWDFGTPKALYVPDYNIEQGSSIYSKFWQNYIRDQYDENTRVVECNVLLKGRVIGDWLQNFYYWDGRYWVLNKIVDYNPTSNGTTKCEFISINDTNNYL